MLNSFYKRLEWLIGVLEFKNSNFFKKLREIVDAFEYIFDGTR